MKKQLFRYSLAGLLAVAFAFFPQTSVSEVIFVDQNAPGAGNGTSWHDACLNLQDALAAASAGDEIWVAQGVYKPVEIFDLNEDGIMDPREAVFFIPSGVALYGGFNGTEESLEERDWVANPTILSGDIDNNDLNADGNFIAENTGDIAGNNSYHVLYTENADASTRLDGFIVTAGKADIAAPVAFNDPNLDGGGWYNRLSAPSYASSPSIVNTAFTGNYAESEGGAYYSSPGPAGGESSSLIENCTFSGNLSNNTGGAVFIGSFNAGTYQPQILNCRFTGNEAWRRGGAIYLVGDQAEIVSSYFENNVVTAVAEDMSTLPGSGGAVSLVASAAQFEACMFINNSATGNPTGAFEGGGGGAVYMSVNEPQTASIGASTPRFSGCGFYNNSVGGNTAAWGGAVVYLSDGGILEPFFVNCVFSGNEAQSHGGAVAGFTRVINEPAGFTPLLAPLFTNCTFTGNVAGQMGGAIYHAGYTFEGSQVLESVIENTILWENSAGSDGNEIFSTGGQFISYSLIAGSGGSGAGWDGSLGTDGGNNTNLNPWFVNASSPMGPDNIPATGDDGLRIYQFSNAVNAGNSAAIGLAGITEDYIGANRIHHGVVDMGAYERTGFILGSLDFVWVLNWGGFQPPCLTCPDNWGFLLERIFEFDPHFVWKDPGHFIRQGNAAVITGEIMNVSDPDVTFKVHLLLERQHNWKTWSRQQGSWFTETDEAKAIAREEHENWLFWTLSPKSYLEGTGKVEGTLKLKQWNSSEKTGFQMGIGANAQDADFGMAGYFDYNGKLVFNGKKLQVMGKGSLNFDGVPCENDCEEQFLPLASGGVRGNNKSAELPSAVSMTKAILIYPVPAGDFLVLESADTENGTSLVKVLDASGRVLLTDKWNRQETTHTLRIDKLNSGLHFLQVVSENPDDTFTERFVRK